MARGLVPFWTSSRFGYLLSKRERIVEPGSDSRSSNSHNRPGNYIPLTSTSISSCFRLPFIGFQKAFPAFYKTHGNIRSA
ncbi:hypothetical protein NXC24_CH01192 [Rhizobium sp. NXC24]|nr:hypothetical protein NXC24_CH01192 [Rhizobium sp. NXC24]